MFCCHKKEMYFEIFLEKNNDLFLKYIHSLLKISNSSEKHRGEII